MSFIQTHTVGDQGAPTWPAPDPSLPESQRLAPHLPIQVLEARGDWWHVRCSNGWETWTDGRWVAQAQPAQPAYPAAAASTGYAQPGYAQAGYAQPGYAQPGYPPAHVQPAARAPRPATSSGSDIGLRTDPQAITAAVGGAVAAISAWLPWFSFFGETTSGWEIPIAVLLDETTTSSDGVKVGLLALASIVAVGAMFVKVPNWAYWLAGAPAIIGGLLAFKFWVSVEGDFGLDLSIGPIAAIVGGLIIGCASLLKIGPR